MSWRVRNTPNEHKGCIQQTRACTGKYFLVTIAQYGPTSTTVKKIGMRSYAYMSKLSYIHHVHVTMYLCIAKTVRVTLLQRLQ